MGEMSELKWFSAGFLIKPGVLDPSDLGMYAVKVHTSEMLLGDPVLLGMDAGQIWGCFIVGGFVLAFMQGSREFLDSRKTHKAHTALFIEYLAAVIVVAGIFSLGLMIGRQ